MSTVIIGAGHAGGAAAAVLRQLGHDQPIILIGEEPHPPYQRPPLSKGWLKGEVGEDGLLLRPRAWYAENQVELRTSTRVVNIDRQARQLTMSTDDTLSYDTLILATGSRARKLVLPGSDLKGFLELRTIEDAEAIKAWFRPGFQLAIIGGGYVGLEVAASARQLGAEVDVLEREDRLLARVAGPVMSSFFRDVHEQNGVRFHFGVAVEGYEGLDGHVSGVRLSGRPPLHCDAVLVGVGAVPNDDLAAAAGLACDDGVIVDGRARTSDSRVFAIGDVTRRPMTFYDRTLRLESVPNALEQARQAAAAIVGAPEPKPETPWFWSDQYDIKLQIGGMPFDVDAVVLRGDPAARKFSLFHLSKGRVQAVEAINSPPEFMVGRQWLASRREVDPARLADVSIPIKEV
ncbi:NAD(P)/FAD-dependent oxidoreductase [Caulobacter sp. FWC26]|jgi:3-phenylpropionate/trans-cinnamate dioxygenase ferredoxin reductase subunit|uniref:NAD(P)/FAD-dependent oxidoreductase n=1 Tax=Caulobacter sp. FWC26 TaxID=69665 RepID=UPI000C14E3CC|nr:FAD-dependent oxidoreductase [Caulobacter sp. FWC26]AZS19270.1 ferredoxin reductase [Caulobacter sp. FWC26]